jgi:hypothetical protein
VQIEQQQAKIRALELRPEQEQFVRVIHDNNYHKKRDTELRKLASLEKSKGDNGSDWQLLYKE